MLKSVLSLALFIFSYALSFGQRDFTLAIVPGIHVLTSDSTVGTFGLGTGIQPLLSFDLTNSVGVRANSQLEVTGYYGGNVFSLGFEMCAGVFVRPFKSKDYRFIIDGGFLQRNFYTSLKNPFYSMNGINLIRFGVEGVQFDTSQNLWDGFQLEYSKVGQDSYYSLIFMTEVLSKAERVKKRAKNDEGWYD